MTAGFDVPRRWMGRSEQRRSLASVPVAGVEPAALHTRFLRVVDEQPWGTLAPHEQAAFTAFAADQTEAHFEEVATVRQLAVIAAAEAEFADDAVFPPSPAFRVNWRRVLAWSPVLALAGVGAVAAARFIVHHPLAYWAVAFTAVYLACEATPAGRS